MLAKIFSSMPKRMVNSTSGRLQLSGYGMGLIKLHNAHLYSEVVLHDEFLNLSSAQVCKLISSDRLTVSSEEQVEFCYYLLNLH